MRVSASSPCFLDIILERVGDVVMYHQSNIAFVYSHAEGGCGNDYLHFVAHEGILVLDFLVGIHLAVVWQCRHSVSREFFCKLYCALCS